ncbi:MAG: prephenate dehydrogenase/arogenate dehydrogenase family protein [Chloroflexi bacterium]|nr:prephenate dehydrogenase/arogenate dehydrogenase family protein [Chloroflexota bacterium]
MTQVTIVGLGLIGSSMGMAIRSARKGVKVVGFDHNSAVQNRAKKIGAIDDDEWRLDKAVQDADLVVLAVPVLEIPILLDNMAPWLKPGTAITDTATTKARVMEWAVEKVPADSGFIGGHPLAGRGLSGQDSASPDLFVGASYPLMPTPRAPELCVRTVVEFVEMLGATPRFVDVSEHDSYIAAVSNGPALMSSALVLAASKSAAWGEIGKFASDEFGDLSRLAGVDPEITHGICQTNPEMMLHWVDAYINELTDLRHALAGMNDEDTKTDLKDRLTEAWEQRLRWSAGVSPTTEMPGTETGTMTESLGQMFLGGGVMGRIRGKRGHEKDRRN